MKLERGNDHHHQPRAPVDHRAARTAVRPRPLVERASTSSTSRQMRPQAPLPVALARLQGLADLGHVDFGSAEALDPRAITLSHRNRVSVVISSAGSPSAMNWPLPARRSTQTGRSPCRRGTDRVGSEGTCGVSGSERGLRSRCGRRRPEVTSATNRNLRQRTVWMYFCRVPSSPSARRADLTTVEIAASVMKRLSQTFPTSNLFRPACRRFRSGDRAAKAVRPPPMHAAAARRGPVQREIIETVIWAACPRVPQTFPRKSPSHAQAHTTARLYLFFNAG